MLIPMSSWLESVITALAPCDFTTWMAPARAMSGAFPEFASTSANRRSGRPACFIAWFAVPTARRIESAQLGVAMDPLRSITWPMFTVTVFAPSGLQAAHRTSAAATRDILVIPSPLRVESRPPSDCPARSRRGQKNVDGEGPFSGHLAGDRGRFSLNAGGGRHQPSGAEREDRERDGQGPGTAQPHLRIVRRLPPIVACIELHGIPPSTVPEDCYTRVR